MRVAVARNFKGGLNTFDSPLGLSPQYLVELDNLYPDSNGVLRLRYGTTRFADISAQVTAAIGCVYFNGRIVVVGANGRVVTIDGTGTVVVVWNTAIAAALPGSPAGWSTGLTFASFTQFRGNLIICNGVDKPITLSSAFVMTYLQDAGTGSNVNVPRAKYCATHNNYLILANTPTDKTTLFIGNKGSFGTFVGDPAPNDAVNFQTATYITEGSLAIKGLTVFRDRLLVLFRGASLAVILGRYEGSPAVHVPAVDDTIDGHGAAGHNLAVVLGEDALFADTVGVSSLQRALITNSLSPQRETTLIADDIQQAFRPFSEAVLEDQAFAVHDRIQQHVLFFSPAAPGQNNRVFVYCYDRSQRFKAWTEFTGMRYQCGCRTEEGRVFLVDGGTVYYYRNMYEPFYQDYGLPGDQPFSDGTLFTDGTGFSDPNAFVGTDINFSLKTPISDLRMPSVVKNSRYLEVVAEGDGVFTLNMYADRFTQVPALTSQFNQTTQPSGQTPLALRPSNNTQMYAWPCKFRYTQFEVTGSARDAFNLVAIKLHYLPGGIYR